MMNSDTQERFSLRRHRQFDMWFIHDAKHNQLVRDKHDKLIVFMDFRSAFDGMKKIRQKKGER